MGLKQKSIKTNLNSMMDEYHKPKTLLMSEVLNDNDLYSETDVNRFWKKQSDEFKNGKYRITYDEEGITKIERVEEEKNI